MPRKQCSGPCPPSSSTSVSMIILNAMTSAINTSAISIPMKATKLYNVLLLRMVTYWLNGEETSSETESALEQGAKNCIRTKYNMYEAFDGKIPVFLPQEIHHKNKQQDHFDFHNKINVM